jgi:hypothetical protein
MSEENRDVTITSIDLSMSNVFWLVFQFAVAFAVVGGVFWSLFRAVAVNLK